MHRWDLPVAEAVALQRRLRDRLVLEPPAGLRVRRVAGADIAIARGEDRGYAGIVVLDAESRATVAEASAAGAVPFPYVPGLLSFRELPLLELAWARLAEKPDVLIFDGVGYAHPRRFGLACHGGLRFGVPSIGCAKSILVGTHGPLADQAGATAELVHRGEVVGMALRLRAGARPVYVSAGHLMDLPTAVAVVRQMGAGYREPETTRRAHRLVNALRRADGTVSGG
ncbi:MAG TPA: endonuclease V [Gemmatimonadales bacterium]|nr:endonuclease V [Gemmatimonadales bacterium]